MAHVHIFVGHNIHNVFRDAEGDADIWLFPELGAPDENGQRWPRHAQPAVEEVRARFKTALQTHSGARPLKVVTHAAFVLNAAGEMISRDELRPGHVVVALCGREPGGTEVQIFGFDKEGVMDSNWPFGWFDWQPR